MKIVAISLGAISLGGCAYPVSSIDQGAEAGHLRFTGPAGLAIRVDGQDRGALPDARPLIINVSPGRHLVEEISSGGVVLHRQYEIGAGSTVEINGENN